MPFLDEQCWAEICEPRGGLPPALILDRDGVVVEEVGYLRRPKDVQIIPDIIPIMSTAVLLGWYVGLTTNQAGIEHGLYTWDDFHKVQHEISMQLAGHNIKLDFVLACSARAEHPWRKPEPGMINHLKEKLPFDIDRSITIGDKLSDLIAADEAGVASLIHAKTGHWRKERPAVVAYKFKHDLLYEDPKKKLQNKISSGK